MRTLHVFYRRGAGNAEERMANGQWRMASSEWRTASSQSYPALEPVSSIRGDRDRTLDIRPQTMDHRPWTIDPLGPKPVYGLWSVVYGLWSDLCERFQAPFMRWLVASYIVPHLASRILHLVSCILHPVAPLNSSQKSLISVREKLWIEALSLPSSPRERVLR